MDRTASDLPEQKNALKIAVIEEKIFGLREQQRAYYNATQTRFDQIEGKVDELTAVLNRGRGAYAASMALAASIGAVLLGLLHLASSYFHK